MDPYDRQPEGYDTHDSGQTIQPTQDQTLTPETPLAKGRLTATTVFCVQCGYNLTGVAIGANCPECGRVVAPSFHSQMLPTSGKAITSMVLGICSIPMCVLYGVPAMICGVLAIIFSRIAKAQIQQGEAGANSKGMATAGMICGIIGLGLGLVYICIVGAFIIVAARSHP